MQILRRIQIPRLHRVLGLVFLSCLNPYSSSATTTSTLLPTTSERNKVQDAFIAGLVGDALALGSHYEYDARKIKEKVGEYTHYHDPGQLCSVYIRTYTHTSMYTWKHTHTERNIYTSLLNIHMYSCIYTHI